VEAIAALEGKKIDFHICDVNEIWYDFKKMAKIFANCRI
jgi:hypothetical protein